MTVFTMHRNRIFRMNQRIDQLDLFLTCMAGYVGILENNIRPFHRKLIDHSGNCFFISRNRVGAENNGIARLDLHFTMHVGCHTGKCCHGLALASGCDQHHLLIRIILHLIQLDQGILRHVQIAKLCRRADNIDHTATLYHTFASIFIGRIDDLLYTVHIGCKRCNDDPCIFMLCENIIKRLTNGTLGHRKSFSLCIGTIAHQCQHTLFADFSKTLQIDRISEYRSVIHFKVTGVHHDTCR